MVKTFSILSVSPFKTLLCDIQSLKTIFFKSTYMFCVFLRVQFTVNNLWRQVVIEHELPPKENSPIKTQKRKVSNADFNLYDKQRLC